MEYVVRYLANSRAAPLSQLPDDEVELSAEWCASAADAAGRLRCSLSGFVFYLDWMSRGLGMSKM